jgi:hypothetical protein
MSEFEEKLYPDLNPVELGKYYTDHVMAMTAESLHSKAAIAKQLAWRDKKIDEQAEELRILRLYATGVIKQVSIYHAKIYKLIDESGNPTPLLTGVEE